MSKRPYELLPSVYRIRDTERGAPLRALLELVEKEYERLREDVDGLYEDWFVETCSEWVVPYIGDLLGVSGLAEIPGGVASQRAVVANTIRYRRRKGTAPVLEQLARDVTGWPARVVEYFQLLGVTQYVDHIRPFNVRTPDLRNADRLEHLDTPLDTAAHTADVRHIDVLRGRHNIGNIGLHLWRLESYALKHVDARAEDAALGRWRFDPAGRDVPLFNRPRTETEITHLAEEVDLPGRLRRRALHAELTALRAPGPSGSSPAEPVFFAEPEPAVRIQLDDEPVPVSRLHCCHLADWHRPTSPEEVAFDPVLGRLTLPEGVAPERVRVDFAYGFSGDVGAGPYDQRSNLEAASAFGTLRGSPNWRLAVSRDAPPEPGVVVSSLTEAVEAWKDRADAQPGDVGEITILDSATYDEDLTGTERIVIPAASRLVIRVGDDQRPHVVGSIEVEGEDLGTDSAAEGELVLAGLSVEGDLRLLAGDLAGVMVAGCTFHGEVTAADNPHSTVRLLRSICARVGLEDVPGLGLTDSIVVADIQAPGAHVEVEACTVLSGLTARTLSASNSILRALVYVERRQTGCVRFSHLPADARAPRQFRCTAVAPKFTSVDPGAPGFCQLAQDCPQEIVTGADDEGEMGAFHFLQQHRRLSNLRSQLDHYLRFGLEAGVFFET